MRNICIYILVLSTSLNCMPQCQNSKKIMSINRNYRIVFSLNYAIVEKYNINQYFIYNHNGMRISFQYLYEEVLYERFWNNGTFHKTYIRWKFCIFPHYPITWWTKKGKLWRRCTHNFGKAIYLQRDGRIQYDFFKLIYCHSNKASSILKKHFLSKRKCILFTYDQH